MDPTSPGFAGLTIGFRMENPVTSKGAGCRETVKAVTAFSEITTEVVDGLNPKALTTTSCVPTGTCWFPWEMSCPSTVTTASGGVAEICRNPIICVSVVWYRRGEPLNSTHE